VLQGKNAAVDLAPYMPPPMRGRFLVQHPLATEDCGCLTWWMPSINDIPPVSVTMFCDKHELGQLLAEERVRLERAWAAKGP